MVVPSNDFSATSTIERYQKSIKNRPTSKQMDLERLQHFEEEVAIQRKKIELLEETTRKLLGDGLDSSSIDELQQVERQLERSLSIIRSRKILLFCERINQLKEEGKILRKKNAELREKYEERQLELSIGQQFSSLEQVKEVETQLFIGLPNR
ncbi:unnamed protein product [Coffea canephora]|uniref:K-box domain-containing protein n=1 Tax=Coffea canephora TaxID=49390 RepID=A0A068VA71_COFCA|nr:unnamed protein product [Coffea canephora]